MRRPLRRVLAPRATLATLVTVTALIWSGSAAAGRTVSPAAPPVHRLVVPATLTFAPRTAWTDTGVHLDGRAVVAITAAGTVRGVRGGGRPSGTGAVCPLSAAPHVVAPGLPCGSLVARLGDGAPFEVGPGTALRAPAGELRLAVDAEHPPPGGRWTVHVAPGRLSAGYVALGDSYASGLGSHDYLTGTGSTTTTTSDPSAGTGCYRATDGYAEQLAGTTGDSLDFAACSGATVADLVAGPDAQDATLGLDTKLVTLSIGGNDVGFSSVLTSCIVGIGSPGRTRCADRDQEAVTAALARLLDGAPAGTVTLPGVDGSGRVVTHTSPTPLPGLTSLYEQVGRAAPNAHILVIGYPLLFESATFEGAGPVGTCRVGTALGLSRYSVSAADVT